MFVTPELWAIIAVGVGIAGLFYRLDTRIDRLDSHVRAQGERLARLEGRVDTLTGSVEALIAVFVKPSGETT